MYVFCLHCSVSWSSRRVLQGRSSPWSVQVCVLVRLQLLPPRTVNMVRSNTQQLRQEIIRTDLFNRNSLLHNAQHFSFFFTAYLCLSHTINTTIIVTTWMDATNIIFFLRLRLPQRAVPDRIWLISGSVWGTGSSCCRPMPSRTTTASPGPEPLHRAPHQVRATTAKESWLYSGDVTTLLLQKLFYKYGLSHSSLWGWWLLLKEKQKESQQGEWNPHRGSAGTASTFMFSPALSV